MDVEKHELVSDFPEHKELIRALRATNEQFRQLLYEHQKVSDLVYKLEVDFDKVTDEELEAAKKKRLALTDDLYHMLIAAARAKAST